jgi:hypothetical protein
MDNADAAANGRITLANTPCRPCRNSHWTPRSVLGSDQHLPVESRLTLLRPIGPVPFGGQSGGYQSGQETPM